MIPASTVVTRWRRPTDPQFANVKWLLPMELGGVGSFYDYSSARRNTISTAENQDATSAKFGAFGGNFQGGGVQDNGSASFWKFLADGTSWTIDGWYANDFNVGHNILTNAVSTSAVGLYLAMTSGRNIEAYMFNGNVGVLVLNAPSIGPLPNDANKHYLRITWDYSLASNNLSVYCDGSLVGQASKTGNLVSSSNPAGNPVIGARTSAVTSNFRMDDFRVTSGIARTDNSVVPFEALPIW